MQEVGAARAATPIHVGHDEEHLGVRLSSTQLKPYSVIS